MDCVKISLARNRRLGEYYLPMPSADYFLRHNTKRLRLEDGFGVSVSKRFESFKRINKLLCNIIKINAAIDMYAVADFRIIRHSEGFHGAFKSIFESRDLINAHPESGCSQTQPLDPLGDAEQAAVLYRYLLTRRVLLQDVISISILRIINAIPVDATSLLIRQWR